MLAIIKARHALEDALMQATDPDPGELPDSWHELTITFEPKDDDESEHIIQAVEALGYEITDINQMMGMSGGVVRRRPREDE